MVLLYSKTQKAWRQAPDFSLLWVDGNRYSLSSFQNKQWLAIIFTCNHCPYAKASRPVIQALCVQYPEIGYICINSNDPNAYPEDDYKHMQSLSINIWLECPYVMDTTQQVATSYDAQCTPDNYLFKRTKTWFSLFFHGRFNDNRQHPEKVTEKNFEEHIIKLINGKPTSNKRSPSIWCSIKRKNSTLD